jgi:hypothetical protein
MAFSAQKRRVGVLSSLQEQAARIIASLEEARDFALAGGAALIVRADIDRRTRDLDFFGLDPAAVDRLSPIAEQALREAGLNVDRVVDNPGFVRFVVASGEDRTEIDLASDARLFPLEERHGIRLLAGEELAVDKVLAVFGRAEARDFTDLMALEDRYELDHLLELAAEKDRGFDPTVFAEMVDRFGRLRRDEFAVNDAQYEVLRRRVVLWRTRAIELARQRGRSHSQERDRDDDLGLGH